MAHQVTEVEKKVSKLRFPPFSLLLVSSFSLFLSVCVNWAGPEESSLGDCRSQNRGQQPSFLASKSKAMNRGHRKKSLLDYQSPHPQDCDILTLFWLPTLSSHLDQTHPSCLLPSKGCLPWAPPRRDSFPDVTFKNYPATFSTTGSAQRGLKEASCSLCEAFSFSMSRFRFLPAPCPFSLTQYNHTRSAPCQGGSSHNRVLICPFTGWIGNDSGFILCFLFSVQSMKLFFLLVLVRSFLK